MITRSPGEGRWLSAALGAAVRQGGLAPLTGKDEDTGGQDPHLEPQLSHQEAGCRPSLGTARWSLRLRPPARHQSLPGPVQPGELCFSSDSELNPQCALDQLLCSLLLTSVSLSVQRGWGTRQQPNITPDLGSKLPPWQRARGVLTTVCQGIPYQIRSDQSLSHVQLFATP